MSVPQSLWASVQGDPVFMRKTNGWDVHKDDVLDSDPAE
jgi:hypothetical protein